MKVEVDVLGSPSPAVSVDVKQHLLELCAFRRSGAVCESRGGRPGLPVPNSPYGLCGGKERNANEEKIVIAKSATRRETIIMRVKGE